LSSNRIRCLNNEIIHTLLVAVLGAALKGHNLSAMGAAHRTEKELYP